MKILKWILAILFSFQGYEAFASCSDDKNYDEEIECSNKTFTANNSEQLSSYRDDFGLEDGEYKNLKITFDIQSASDLELVSPCRITIKENVNLDMNSGAFCIDGRQGVHIGSNVSMSITGTPGPIDNNNPMISNSFEIQAEGEVIFSDGVDFIGDEDFIINAEHFRLRPKASFRVPDGNLTINIDGEELKDRILLESSSKIFAVEINLNGNGWIVLQESVGLSSRTNITINSSDFDDRMFFSNINRPCCMNVKKAKSIPIIS